MSRRSTEHSETEFQSGLRDVLLEVIAPALIMLMLGSLVFFSLEVLYRGNHRLPIHWVFGLYVFAIVLIGRISIMEGFARAQFFAAFLIVAVLIQTGIGPHVIVVFLTWWAASKLTWDCTFIDESRDVTGQGLVSAAFERWRLFRETFLQVWRGEVTLAQAMDSKPPSDTTPSSSEEPSGSVTRWMKDLVWKSKRKNTPGLWAFFFFVGGLVLFAAGQLFVESSGRARDYSLRMFAIYSFSGLGLMMFISLVGLFRYLKQRGTTMPDSIARSWLATGTVIALAVVGIMLFLPWPNTGVSLSSWVPGFQTAKRSGENSPLTERGKVEGPNGTGKPDDRGAPGKGDKPGEQQGTGGVEGGDKQGDQPKGRPGSTSGGNVGGGRGPKPASSSTQSSQSNSQPQKSNSSKPNSSQQSNESGAKTSPQQSGKKPSESKSGAGESAKDGPKPSADSQPQAKNSSAPGQSSPPPAQGNNKSQPPPGDQRQEEPKSNKNSSTPSNATKNEPGETAPQAKSPDANPPPLSWIQNVWSFLKSIVSILIWIAAIVTALILFARYRVEIIDGLGNFYKSLLEWFARWFGGTKTPGGGNPISVGSVVRQPLLKPFSSFRNPFANADWNRKPPVEIVEYSFAAFEALAHEIKMPRQLDETPLEFSRRVAEKYESLNDVRLLAELYSRAAYASANLSSSDVQPLHKLWSRMQAFAQRMHPPQPVGAV